MARLNWIDELPKWTDDMIRLLPSFTTSDPIELKEFSLIPLKGKFASVGDYLAKIDHNISLIKGDVKKELQEKYAIQLAIIQHGYEGVCPNDAVANMIAKSIKSKQNPKAEK